MLSARRTHSGVRMNHWRSSLLLLFVLFAPALAAQELVGVPWTGATGIRTSVDELARLQRANDAATAGVPRAPRIKPLRRPDRSHLPQNPDALPTPVIPKGTDVSTPQEAPKIQTLSLNFLGATLNDTQA